MYDFEECDAADWDLWAAIFSHISDSADSGQRGNRVVTSFLPDGNFLFPRKFRDLDAKYRAKPVLSIFKNELELSASAWRHDYFFINSPMLHIG